MELATMSGVGIWEQRRVWKVLTQQQGIFGWDHDVECSVYHEAWLGNFAELGEALAGEGFPGSKDGDSVFADARASTHTVVIMNG